MDNWHVIEHAEFDISFGSEEEAFEQQADLGAFIQRRLMPVVDGVFNEMSSKGEVLRMDGLEVDLGTLVYHDFQDEMESRLRECLRSVLNEKRLSIKAKPANNEGVFTRQQIELEQFEYFLVTGRLPWNAALSEGRTMDQRVQRIVQSSGAKFGKLLRSAAQKDAVIKRLVSQFPDEILAEIVRLLEPGEWGFVEDILERPELFRPGKDEQPQAPSRLKAHLWEFTFTYLLVERGSLFNRKAYIGSLVRQMAAHDNIGYGELLSSLIGVLHHIEAPSGLKKEMFQLLGELAEETRDSQPVPIDAELKSETPIESALGAVEHGATEADDINLTAVVYERGINNKSIATPARAQHLHTRLAEALVRGAGEELQDIWRMLLHDQPKLLKEALMYYGRQAKVRRNLACGFTEVILKDIVRLLEPGECGFIEAILERPELFRPGRGEQPQAPSRLKAHPWEFTLTYLLVERGSQFNRKAYLGSLVRQMAAHENIRHSELLDSLIGVLRHIEAPSGLKKEMLELLGELAEQEVRTRPDTDVADSQSQALIHAYDLYERLREGLALGEVSNKVSEDGIKALIDQLAQDHPWQLQRFYRELQATERFEANVFDRLPGEVLRRLIEAFLGLTSQAEQGGPSDFIRAIEGHATRARDVKRYYAQILVRLVQHQIIDLEAILAESLGLIVDDTIEDPARDSKTSHGAPKNPVTELQEAPLSERNDQVLADYLKDTAKVSAHRAAHLIRTIERLIIQQPERLRRLLAPRLAGRECAARLIELLPERLLTRVLFVLRAAEHHRLQCCADSLALACLGKEIGAKPEHVHRLKWQFVFEYLFAEGWPFDSTVFAWRFSNYLAAKLHWPDPNTFRALMCQQLALNSLPFTREPTNTLIAALSATPDGGRLPEAASQKADGGELVCGVEEDAQEITEEIYLRNAGQVLAAPYLPRLFSMLNLTEHAVFKDLKAAECAVHLLQFMVDERTDTPEYKLVLNKILCGVSTSLPIKRQIAIGDKEKELIESLLQGMIQNWKSIGNTSVAGLRESFLQREGRLQLKDDAWHLLVEQKAHDMLLDQIPWSFKTIKHPWMERVLYVDWR
jgi:hypothetical protein